MVEAPELMPPLELGKYEGPFHVTSRDVDVVNERGGGTPSVVCRLLGLASAWIVIRILW